MIERRIVIIFHAIGPLFVATHFDEKEKNKSILS